VQIERIGYLCYQLYSLGWHDALYKHPNLIKHLLLSILPVYRRGFVEGHILLKSYILIATTYLGGHHNPEDPDLILYLNADGKSTLISFSADEVGDGIEYLGDFGWHHPVSSIWVRRGTWNFYQDPDYSGDNTGFLEPEGLYNLGHDNQLITSFKRVR
jgi:Beta/Gamma crystallin